MTQEEISREIRRLLKEKKELEADIKQFKNAETCLNDMMSTLKKVDNNLNDSYNQLENNFVIGGTVVGGKRIITSLEDVNKCCSDIDRLLSIISNDITKCQTKINNINREINRLNSLTPVEEE